jgi:hypothetical protein
MPELFNESGNLIGETATSRVRQIKDIAQQHLECLVDSGASVAELKAYTCTLLEEITWVSRQVIIDRDVAIKAKEAEDAEKETD